MLDLAAMFALYVALWVMLPLPEAKGTLLSLTIGLFATLLPTVAPPPLGFLLTPPPFAMFLYVIQIIGVELVWHILAVDVAFSAAACAGTLSNITSGKLLVVGNDDNASLLTSAVQLYNDLYTCFVGHGVFGLLHLIALGLHVWTAVHYKHRIHVLHAEWKRWLTSTTSDSSSPQHENEQSATDAHAASVAFEEQVASLYASSFLPVSPALPFLSHRRKEVEVRELPAAHAVPELEASTFYLYRRRASNPKFGSGSLDTERQPLRPVLVFVHGGGWVGGHAAFHPTAALCFALALIKDWVVISIDYRRAPKHSLPTVVEDVDAAVRWVWQNIAEFGGDPTQLYMGGESAGGHLAALVSLRLGEQATPPSNRRDDCDYDHDHDHDDAVEQPVVRGVFINYPITDVGDVGGNFFRLWGGKSAMRWFLYEKVAMKLPFDGNEHHYEKVSPLAILERRLQHHRDKNAGDSQEGSSKTVADDDVDGLRVSRDSGLLSSPSMRQRLPHRSNARPSRGGIPFVPPFLIVHGSHDTVIPVEESDMFSRVLAEYRAAQRKSPLAEPQIRDLYLRVGGATHGFDAVLSPASVKVASITLQWLDIVQRTSVNTQDQ